MITQFVFLWLVYLMLGTIFALGLTRIYLILKVNKISRTKFKWIHSSANRVHPA